MNIFGIFVFCLCVALSTTEALSTAVDGESILEHSEPDSIGEILLASKVHGRTETLPPLDGLYAV